MSDVTTLPEGFALLRCARNWPNSLTTVCLGVKLSIVWVLALMFG